MVIFCLILGNAEIIEQLTKHGASMNIIDNQGRIPLDLADIYGKLAR